MSDKKEKVGVQDIADILKISASTVSRALNDHPRISKDTKDKVKQVAKRLGYFAGATDLSTVEKGDTVTVLIPSFEFSFYREIIKGIRDYFGKKNYDVLIVDTRNDESNVSDFFGKYKKLGISGVIHVVSDRTIPADFYSIPLEEALPVVSVLEPDDNTKVSSVLPDMFNGIYNSLQHFYSLGVKEISLLLEYEDNPLDNQILNSFLAAIESLRGEVTGFSVFYTGGDESSVNRILNDLSGMDAGAEVLFVKNVITAFSAELELHRTGIKVPDDIMLVSIDTALGVKQIAANMSLLKLPAYDMGYKAAAMLMEQIKNIKTDKKVSVIPANFILKGSALRI